jgi:hypothetical protein
MDFPKKKFAFSDRSGHKQRNWVSYNEAKQIVKRLGIRKFEDYRRMNPELRKSLYLPSSPDSFYINKGWISWPQFFERENLIHNRFEFIPYQEARKIVIKLKIRSQAEYRKLTLKERRKLNLPSTPDKHYAGKGWKGWGAFISPDDNYVVRVYPDFSTFHEAKETVKRMGIKSSREYSMLPLDERRKVGLPAAPFEFYEGKGWVSWRDYLGTEWCDFEEAKEIVQKMEIKDYREYRKLPLEEKKQLGLPAAPYKFYKGEGWVSWGDYFGREYSSIPRTTFEEAKKIVKRIKIKGVRGYRELTLREKMSLGLPSNPDKTYKKKGWISWPDFLGKEG